MAAFYAVARGRVPGVYNDWNACKAQVEKLANAKFKKFNTYKEAVDYIKSFKDAAATKHWTISPLSLPLPLSPTRKNSNSASQTGQEAREMLFPSQAKNKNGLVVKRLNYQVPQKNHTVTSINNKIPSVLGTEASENTASDANPAPSCSGAHVPQTSRTKVTSCSKNVPIPISQMKNDSVLNNNVNLKPPCSCTQVSETNGDVPQIKSPAQLSDSRVPQLPAISNLEERFDVFEKTYLEFHKQMVSEIRNFKKILSGFKKKAMKSALAQMQLQTSAADGLISLETRFKSVVLDFSSQLSSLQKQVASDDTNAVAFQPLPSSSTVHQQIGIEKQLGKGRRARAATGSTSRAGKTSRRKLDTMMQPMTPAQVLVANKRSYHTDVTSGAEPPEKVAKNDFCHDLVATVKVEPDDDEVDHSGSHQFDVDADGYVHVYTDGACEKNGYSLAKAGIGVWFGENHPLNSSEPVRGRATNNTAEIQAAQYAVELARGAGIRKLCINTDSEFLIKSITKWIYGWKKNNWKVANGGPVKNKENFQDLDAALKGMDVKWNHVPGHRGILGNEMADSLARAGATRYNSG